MVPALMALSAAFGQLTILPRDLTRFGPAPGPDKFNLSFIGSPMGPRNPAPCPEMQRIPGQPHHPSTARPSNYRGNIPAKQNNA